MSAVELKALAKLSKSGWKKLANADQSDADEVLVILREVLEEVDRIEAAEEAAALLQAATEKQQALQSRAVA